MNQNSIIRPSRNTRTNYFIICLFFGMFGAHRFMVKDIKGGLIYVFTAGLFCFGWIYDLITIATGSFFDGTDVAKNEYERNKEKYANYYKDIQFNINEVPDGFIPLDNWVSFEQKGCTYTGVYVLYNNNKKMYYVGQAKNVAKRIDQHRTGHGGNPDVYFDIRSGDTFFIRTMSLSESAFDNLDDFEKKMISYYDAYRTGYNKTSGNNV